MILVHGLLQFVSRVIARDAAVRMGCMPVILFRRCGKDRHRRNAYFDILAKRDADDEE